MGIINRNKVAPLPAKLARLRRAHDALREVLKKATERRLELIGQLRAARHSLDKLEAEPKGYAGNEREQLKKDLADARQEVKELEGMLADLESEVEEIKVDLYPLGRTLTSLEKHLGIDRNDQFMRPNQHRVQGAGGNFGGEAL